MDSHLRKDVTERQQRHYEELRDVCEYEQKTKTGFLILTRKVAYAMHDKPDEESKCSNGHTGYSEVKYSTIKPVVDFIVRVNDEKKTERDRLHMAIIFVYVECDNLLVNFPVFRILLTKSTWKFVDTNCRVYSSWANYLNFNELPEGHFCGPVNGIYSADSEGNVRLGWGLTPAAQPEQKVIGAADKVSSAVALGSTALSIVGFFTPLAPVLGVAAACCGVTGAYNAVRKSVTLIDRAAHGQTLNPFDDPEAAATWLSVAGGLVGVAAGAVTGRAAELARTGQVMSRAGRITCDALNVSSLAITGAEVGFSTFKLSERVKEGEVTPLEVYQFTSSLLFFGHATISFRTASQIIKDTQKGVIKDFEKSLSSKEQRKEFKKLAKSTAATGENPLDGQAKVIRSIRRIDNKEGFFDAMVGTRNDFEEQDVIFSENGNIIVNDVAEVHPMKLYELGPQQRKEFLSLAKQASNGTISDATFRARFDSVLSTTAAGAAGRNSDATQAVNTLTSQLQKASPLINIGKHEVLTMVSVVDQLTDQICSKTDNEYAKWWQLILKHVSKLVQESYETYEGAQKLEKHLPTFGDKRPFNFKQGTTRVFIKFLLKEYDRYSKHIDELKRDIKKMNKNENLKTKDEICPRCKQVM